MGEAPYRYRSADEDSARWRGFPFRTGDVVISTRSKSGTTWMQMICALLVLQTPDLPAPLSTLSPWLDWLVTPREEVVSRLEAQRHRRFVKTHTPLDGIPLLPTVTYVVVALPGVMWHLVDAWERRGEPKVVLVHYEDLQHDLEGQMRRLAVRLGIDVSEATWPRLVEAATFESMRSRSDLLAPDPSDVLRSRQAFFRSGSSGAGRALLPAEALDRYHARAARLAPADLLAWLHRDRAGTAAPAKP